MIFEALLMGVLEGLTEFIPVSSTGHLILAGNLLGFKGPPGAVFEIAIQLGAILAICIVYFARLWNVVIKVPNDPQARRFVMLILLGFLPAMFIGVLAHKTIKSLLFNPTSVSIALIIGGIIILLVEQKFKAPKFAQIEDFSPSMALKIGLFQCIAMVPGVSRSGATIIGALWLGASKKAATEFSFFVAIPTMFAATTYDLYKNRDHLVMDDVTLIAIGFAAAFVTAALVVRTVVGFVERHGFAPFGYYRIALGVLMLSMIYLS